MKLNDFKPSYRPEIDGLRALSVLIVIFYHSNISLFNNKFLSGGYIGVDIFFVISGYLISSIILKELKQTNNFSFKNFYKRRARRILPALFFVMLVSLPFAYYFALPNFFVDYSKSIISSVSFISNFYFWSQGAGYDLIQYVEFQPFLHTWSLSVEEQFYFLQPIVLLLSFRYLRKYLPYIILIGIFSSLILSNWMSYNHASFNFYILPTRGWELLAGTFLAYYELKAGRKNIKYFSQILPFVGLVLIIVFAVLANHETFHPSFYTITPVVGACLIIWFSNKNDLVTKMLSSKLFVSTGLISYSLYLWHYPILIFFKEINLSILFFFTFALSIITYKFIEKPFRQKKIKSKFYNLKTLLYLAAFLIFCNSFVIAKGGFYKRTSYPKIIENIVHNDRLKDSPNMFLRLKINFLTQLNKKILNKEEKSIKKTLVYNENKRNIYIVGDSHLYGLSRMLKKHPNIKKYNFHDLNASGCYYIYGFDQIHRFSKKIQSYCNKQTQNDRRNKILSKKNSIVIMGGRLPLYLKNKRYDNLEGGKEANIEWFSFYNDKGISVEEGVTSSIRDLLQNKVKIILIYPVPVPGWHVPKKILDTYIWNKDNFEGYLKKNPITTSYQNYINYSKSSFELLDQINHINLFKIYPHEELCNNTIKNRCITHDSNNLLYLDTNHLNTYGNQFLLERILKNIEN